jgi:hypothetical protein
VQPRSEKFHWHNYMPITPRRRLCRTVTAPFGWFSSSRPITLVPPLQVSSRPVGLFMDNITSGRPMEKLLAFRSAMLIEQHHLAKWLLWMDVRSVTTEPEQLITPDIGRRRNTTHTYISMESLSSPFSQLWRPISW